MELCTVAQTDDYMWHTDSWVDITIRLTDRHVDKRIELKRD